MATVEVTFTPLPAHVRTARLVATAVARRSGVDEALLDEVRLAVGEACSRAVEAHRRHGDVQRVDQVRVEELPDGGRPAAEPYVLALRRGARLLEHRGRVPVDEVERRVRQRE